MQEVLGNHHQEQPTMMHREVFIPGQIFQTHLPIIVDPTHSTGKKSLITPAALAGGAAGADGIIVEVHWKPDEALCDKAQALSPEGFKELNNKVTKLYNFVKDL